MGLDHLALLRAELDRITELVGSATGDDLARPVPACPPWTAYDVVAHLGRVHRWAAAATETPPDGDVGDTGGEPVGRTPAALAEWFAEGAADLVTALGTDPATPCWTLAEPRTVDFWRRRQAHETAVHRWDLEVACGSDATIDPALARDGIAEVVDAITPRQVRLGRLASSPVWVRLVSGGVEWRLATSQEQHREPVGTVSGSAEDVLLLLWGRRHLDDLEVDGDGARVAAFLAAAIVP